MYLHKRCLHLSVRDNMAERLETGLNRFTKRSWYLDVPWPPQCGSYPRNANERNVTMMRPWNYAGAESEQESGM